LTVLDGEAIGEKRALREDNFDRQLHQVAGKRLQEVSMPHLRTFALAAVLASTGTLALANLRKFHPPQKIIKCRPAIRQEWARYVKRRGLERADFWNNWPGSRGTKLLVNTGKKGAIPLGSK
jgi:hypothetical protein